MAQLIGLARLGADAEVRYTTSGDAVSGLRLAFDYRVKKEKMTQWVEGSLWGALAEALSEYLLKGKQVFVVIDDVHIEEYEHKDGKTGTKLVGRISKIELAGSKSDDSGSGDRQRPTGARGPAASPQREQAEPRRQAAKPKTGTGFDEMDDDIPF
jgi:single-strand DNA-binding protein